MAPEDLTERLQPRDLIRNKRLYIPEDLKEHTATLVLPVRTMVACSAMFYPPLSLCFAARLRHGQRAPSACREIMAAKDLAERNAKLVQPMQTILAARAGIFEAAPAVATATALGLALNLLNVFLYMTNYNLVIPTLDAFCRHLGVPSSLSGAVIGAADIMAIIVSVGYSLWTNHSFRQPLLFASVTCLIGNLLVTLAYNWGGLPLLFLGRLLTGAGAARALNRRYIADFVSIDARTTASIGFVAASAAGMAAGPFLVLPLSSLLDRYGDSWTVLGGLTLNVITVSGWIMVFTWAAFSIVALLFFVEPLPPRSSPSAAGVEPLLPSTIVDVARVASVPEEDLRDDADADDAITVPLMLPPPMAAGAAPAGAAEPPLPAAADAAEALPLPTAAAGVSFGAKQADPADVAAAESAAAALELPPRSWRARLHSDAHLLPTIACTLMLFLLKLLQQGSVSAVPLFTMSFYGWDMSTVGLFMAAMSLAMLPLNFSVAAITAVVR